MQSGAVWLRLEEGCAVLRHFLADVCKVWAFPNAVLNAAVDHTVGADDRWYLPCMDLFVACVESSIHGCTQDSLAVYWEGLSFFVGS